MNESQRVLGPGCGQPDAKLLFVGEAPGRFGADRTAVPFSGDASGKNFEAFLSGAKLSRDDCFVTNAVLCNPRDEAGNNAPPNRTEQANCRNFLRQQVELIDPLLVVSLGAVALAALNDIEQHGLVLRQTVRRATPWFGRELVPLYHPGARALIHRNRRLQQNDYRYVARRLAMLVND